jgi:hypothetical protein
LGLPPGGPFFFFLVVIMNKMYVCLLIGFFFCGVAYGSHPAIRDRMNVGAAFLYMLGVASAYIKVCFTEYEADPWKIRTSFKSFVWPFFIKDFI